MSTKVASAMKTGRTIEYPETYCTSIANATPTRESEWQSVSQPGDVRRDRPSPGTLPAVRRMGGDGGVPAPEGGAGASMVDGGSSALMRRHDDRYEVVAPQDGGEYATPSGQRGSTRWKGTEGIMSTMNMGTGNPNTYVTCLPRPIVPESARRSGPTGPSTDSCQWKSSRLGQDDAVSEDVDKHSAGMLTVFVCPACSPVSAERRISNVEPRTIGLMFEGIPKALDRRRHSGRRESMISKSSGYTRQRNGKETGQQPIGVAGVK